MVRLLTRHSVNSVLPFSKFSDSEQWADLVEGNIKDCRLIDLLAANLFDIIEQQQRVDHWFLLSFKSPKRNNFHEKLTWTSQVTCDMWRATAQPCDMSRRHEIRVVLLVAEKFFSFISALIRVGRIFLFCESSKAELWKIRKKREKTSTICDLLFVP